MKRRISAAQRFKEKDCLQILAEFSFRHCIVQNANLISPGGYMHCNRSVPLFVIEQIFNHSYCARRCHPRKVVLQAFDHMLAIALSRSARNW